MIPGMLGSNHHTSLHRIQLRLSSASSGDGKISNGNSIEAYEIVSVMMVNASVEEGFL
jgi:hypothetical protein